MSAVPTADVIEQRAPNDARFLFDYDGLDSAYHYRNGVMTVSLSLRRPLWAWSVAVARTRSVPGAYEVRSNVRVNSAGDADLASSVYALRRVLAGRSDAVANDHDDRTGIARDSFLATGTWFLFVGSRLILTLEP